MLLHVLGHVDPYHGLLVIEHEFSQCPGQLRLAPTPVGPMKINEPIGHFLDPEDPTALA